MLAVGWRLQTLDDRGDLIQIGEIERNVGPDREPDPVRQQRNLADEIENRRLGGFAAGYAVVDRDLEHVELIEVVTRPISYGRAIAQTDRGALIGAVHRQVIASTIDGGTLVG